MACCLSFFQNLRRIPSWQVIRINPVCAMYVYVVSEEISRNTLYTWPTMSVYITTASPKRTSIHIQVKGPCTQIWTIYLYQKHTSHVRATYRTNKTVQCWRQLMSFFLWSDITKIHGYKWAEWWRLVSSSLINNFYIVRYYTRNFENVELQLGALPLR